MKRNKLIVLMLAFTLTAALALAGCGKQQNESEEPAETETETEAQTEEDSVIDYLVLVTHDNPLPDGWELYVRYAAGHTGGTFDPAAKYLKPAGYGNPPAMHSEYIEIGRRPWKYRPGGSAICPPLAEMPQERSRFSSNDIGELGAAVARGVQEISFDLDPAGDWEGKLEGILRKLSCHAIMDIHVNGSGWDDDALKRLYGLVFDFDAVGHTVFTAEDEGVRARLAALAPDIPCR